MEMEGDADSEELGFTLIEYDSLPFWYTWKFKFIGQVLATFLIAFSFAAMLFRSEIISPFYFPMIDIVMFYIGFLLLIGIYLMEMEYNELGYEEE